MADSLPNKKAEATPTSGEVTRRVHPMPETSSTRASIAPLQIPDHELLRCIGRGAYGEVWLARSIMGAYRAVKVVWRRSFETGRPFEREFIGIQNFEPVSRSHEALVDILHVGRNDDAGYFFYVMELADDLQTGAQIDPDRYEARTLQREIQERGRLPVHECLRVSLCLIGGLGYLHEQGLVHRDIKPSNIIIVKGVPKLADIGLVCGTESTQSHVGTEGYIPPEGSGTPQADLYSLGKVLFEMGTGKSREKFPDLPTDLRENGERAALLEFNEVLLKACDRDVQRRYQSAHDLEADLALLKMGQSVRAQRRREQHWARTKVALGIAAVITLATLGFMALPRGPVSRISGKVDDQRHAEARGYAQKARFLAGRSSAHLEGEPNNPRVIELLEKAVTLDPDFSEAHAELALAYTLRAFLYAPEEKELLEKSDQAVERALSLNPKLPAAYLARGRLKWTPSHHFPHAAAIDDYVRALALDPNFAEAYHYRGMVFLHVGLLEEATHDLERTVDLNPGNNAAHFRLGVARLYRNEFQKALDKFETIDADFNPDFRIAQICLALIGLGRKEDARRHLESHPTDSGGLITSTKAILHALDHEESKAEDAIRIAAAKRGFGHFHHTQYQIASAYALMDKKDSAMEWLGKSVTQGFNCYPLFESDANLASLRSDARFIKFLAAEKERYDLLKLKYGIKTAPPGEDEAAGVRPGG
jgi:serine/threonine protein kinase